ncbi:MAG TPA: DUF935 family protein [Kiritimatiellia bacterium]|nr:DUF935 family protein [Kiritimatiellia bacterium]
MNLNIRQRILQMLGVQQAVEDFRGTPESIANQMDAAQITSALVEAEQGYVGDLWNLYDSILIGDSWIGSMLTQRKLAVLNDVIQAEPEDKDRPEDRQAADAVNAAIKGLRRFRMGTLSHLMDGVLRPVSVAEMVFRANPDLPGKFKLDRIVPVQHFCQDFRNGRLQLLKQDAANAGRTNTELYDCQPGKHIVHRGHLMSAPDNWGGPMRSIVFLWLLKTCNREWWARSLERWGAPVPIAKYPSGDKAAKIAIREAFSKFYRLGGLIVSDNSSVELIAGAAAGDGTAWEKLQNWAERQITIAILGQDLSTGTEPTGMGSGVADLHGRVRDDVTLMDEMALGETLTTDLAGAIQAANALPGKSKIVLGTGTNLAKATTLSTILSGLYQAGVEPDDPALDDLGSMIGLGLQRAVKPTSLPFVPPGSALSQMIQTEIRRIGGLKK